MDNFRRDPHSGMLFQLCSIEGYLYAIFENNSRYPWLDNQGNPVLAPPTAPRILTPWPRSSVADSYAPLNPNPAYTHNPQQRGLGQAYPPQTSAGPSERRSSQASGSSSQGRPSQTGGALSQGRPSLTNGVGTAAPSPARGGQIHANTLAKGYKIRRDAATFFVPGRVMSVLWSEPAGPDCSSQLSTISVNYLGEMVHSKIRRMVVVRAGHDSCVALSFHTHNGKGVAKPRVRKSDYGIIYTGANAPALKDDEQPTTLGENPVRPMPIRVIPTDKAEMLDVMSRINFAKPYTVEHNWKVKNFGRVDAEDLPGALLEQYFAVAQGR